MINRAGEPMWGNARKSAGQPNWAGKKSDKKCFPRFFLLRGPPAAALGGSPGFPGAPQEASAEGLLNIDKHEMVAPRVRLAGLASQGTNFENDVVPDTRCCWVS